MKLETQKFGIYIHWPYCLSKCPYCDFFSKVRKDVSQSEIIEEYISDLDFYHNLTEHKKVTSIFFGGGTPSLIEPKNIERIINHIKSKWNYADDIEISLEANPNTQTPSLFSDLKSAGINRLSLGVQALNDDDLKFLGRTHDTKQALNSIEQVLKTFDNHSFDLIYARPNQQLKNWETELNQATNFGFKHLSLYQLTIEEGTPFHKQGLITLNEDDALAMYNFTNEFLAKYGYEQYEVSNYALNGFESKHNQLYWQGDDYLGIGKSAHGRIRHDRKIYATTHRKKLEELTQVERAEELIIMGLRLRTGIDKDAFKNICGLEFDDFINKRNLTKLIEQDLIIDTKENIRLHDFALLNKIIEELCT